MGCSPGIMPAPRWWRARTAGAHGRAATSGSPSRSCWRTGRSFASSAISMPKRFASSTSAPARSWGTASTEMHRGDCRWDGSCWVSAATSTPTPPVSRAAKCCAWRTRARSRRRSSPSPIRRIPIARHRRCSIGCARSGPTGSASRAGARAHCTTSRLASPRWSDSSTPRGKRGSPSMRLRRSRPPRTAKPRGRSCRLHDLEARFTEWERQLAAARQARAAVDELAQKRETVRALTEAELGIVQTLEAALLASRLQDARHRLERVEALEQAMAEERGRQEEHTRFAMFPLDRQADVQELRSHLRAARETQADFESRAAGTTTQVQQLEAERETLDAEALGHETRARG